MTSRIHSVLKFPLILAVAMVFMITACDEQSTEGQSIAGYNFQADRAQLETVSQFAPAGLRSASAPRVSLSKASDLALDRSKFKSRRIAETHNMNVRAAREELKSRFDRDLKQCLALDCELTNSNVNTQSGGHINAKIAPEKLGEFLDFVAEGPGELLSHQISADDKTLQYVDTQAKLENKEALRNRLRRLLNDERSRRIEDILKIERELSRTEGEVDSLKGRLRHLSSVTSKATVNVRYEVDYSKVEVRTADIGQSFKKAWRNLVGSTAKVIEFTGDILPWLPVIAVGFWLCVVALRFAFKGALRMIFRREEESGNGTAKTTKTKKTPKSKTE